MHRIGPARGEEIARVPGQARAFDALEGVGALKQRIDRGEAFDVAILTSALTLLTSNKLKPDSKVQIFGEPLQEVRLRQGLEKSYRVLARLHTGDERISLVDRANAVRPQTLF